MLHIASLNEKPVTPREQDHAAERERLVKEMANHLVAGILHAGLNSASDIDVIDYLWRCEDQYHSRVILNHLDDAMYAAKQALIAMEMTER